MTFQHDGQRYELDPETQRWLWICLQFDWLKAAEIMGMPFRDWHALGTERQVKFAAIQLGVARKVERQIPIAVIEPDRSQLELL